MYICMYVCICMYIHTCMYGISRKKYSNTRVARDVQTSSKMWRPQAQARQLMPALNKLPETTVQDGHLQEAARATHHLCKISQKS